MVCISLADEGLTPQNSSLISSIRARGRFWTPGSMAASRRCGRSPQVTKFKIKKKCPVMTLLAALLFHVGSGLLASNGLLDGSRRDCRASGSPRRAVSQELLLLS